MHAKHYDLLIVGGGTGRDVALAGEARGLRVALVERGPLGGTCHNRGCMPTKMLIESAKVAEVIKGSHKFGLTGSLEHVDFQGIVRGVFGFLDAEREEREESLRMSDLVDFYQAEGRFAGAKTFDVGQDRITADRVVIAGGTRPMVPPIEGLDATPHLTSDDALRLDEQPKRLVIIGGGYISTELAYFFGALGTDVTVLARGDRLLDREDAEVSRWFSEEFSRRHRVLFGEQASSVSAVDREIHVVLQNSGETIAADQLLVAAGRRPNTDMLGLEHTGVELDAAGYVKINEYLETNVDGVWAFGDMTGVLPLKHVAVRQARNLIRTLFGGQRTPTAYDAIPHAVFSAPQVAAVGKTEEEVISAGAPYKVGRYEYRHTGMGIALKENGLVKILASPSDDILGCHIVGPYASILIQEVVVAMTAGGKLDAIVEAVHAHPALPQVVEEAAKAAKDAPVTSRSRQPTPGDGNEWPAMEPGRRQPEAGLVPSVAIAGGAMPK